MPTTAQTGLWGRLSAAAVELMLAVVHARHGVDFRPYRRATIERRIRNAMIAARVDDPAAYVVRLRADPVESARLLERLTVKVSRFWRDARALEALERALAARRGEAPGPLRAWSAGCARGEEAYSLAILLAELGFPPGPGPDVLGTDIDQGALAAADQGVYTPDALVELPPHLRDRHLVLLPAPRALHRVSPALRARVAFEWRDLAGEPPPGRFDLVACRNTLIYFDPSLQRRVLRGLLDALPPGGLLWLGEAEWLTHELAGELEPLDRRSRLFRKRGGQDA